MTGPVPPDASGSVKAAAPAQRTAASVAMLLPEGIEDRRGGCRERG